MKKITLNLSIKYGIKLHFYYFLFISFNFNNSIYRYKRSPMLTEKDNERPKRIYAPIIKPIINDNFDKQVSNISELFQFQLLVKNLFYIKFKLVFDVIATNLILRILIHEYYNSKCDKLLNF